MVGAACAVSWTVTVDVDECLPLLMQPVSEHASMMLHAAIANRGPSFAVGPRITEKVKCTTRQRARLRVTHSLAVADLFDLVDGTLTTRHNATLRFGRNFSTSHGAISTTTVTTTTPSTRATTARISVILPGHGFEPR